MPATAVTCIIDDDEIFVYAMTKLIKLKQLSKQVIVFKRADEAIHYLADNQSNTALLPDIVLLDINLPETNGWDFIAQYQTLKSCLKKLPSIYMLSSSVSHEDRQKAEQLTDISSYFIKPLSKENFSFIFDRETYLKS